MKVLALALLAFVPSTDCGICVFIHGLEHRDQLVHQLGFDVLHDFLEPQASSSQWAQMGSPAQAPYAGTPFMVSKHHWQPKPPKKPGYMYDDGDDDLLHSWTPKVLP